MFLMIAKYTCELGVQLSVTYKLTFEITIINLVYGHYDLNDDPGDRIQI